MGLADLIKNTLNSAFPGTSAATGGTPVPQAAGKLSWFDAAKMGTAGTMVAIAVVTVWPTHASQAADYAGYGQAICVGLAAAFGAFVLAVRKLKK
jgi:hypothetical protein